MGRRGPVAEPSALKLLKGNRGKRKIPTDEPKIVPAVASELVPAAGAVLSAAEREVWDWAVAELEGTRVLTKADVLALEQLARATVAWRTVLAMLERDGRILVKRNDKGVVEFIGKHPADGMAATWHTLMRGALADLGLSPAGRARVKAAPAPEKAGAAAGSWREALLRG